MIKQPSTHPFWRKFPATLLVPALLLSFTARAAEAVKLLATEVEPVRLEKRGDVWFADFGQDAFGNLQITFPGDPPAAKLKVRLGEKLAPDGTIDRKPFGKLVFVEVPLAVQPGQRVYRLEIPPSSSHQAKKGAVPPPAEFGEIKPFRYAEIEGSPVALGRADVRQLFVHAPFDDSASGFESSDATLNAVWALCKHTMKATTAFGIYIDGERERKPYEADATINQLSHYACDMNPALARVTFAHLLRHPTWPTEWSLHMPMIAAADYLATGDPRLAAENYDKLKTKLLTSKAREDGLLRASAIVDWPPPERDGYDDGKPASKDGPKPEAEVSAVVNAFYYHALRQMALLATALGKAGDARDFEAKAKQVYEVYNRVFFDPASGVYIDREGSAHASLHANMFPLAFGLVPAGRQTEIVDFVQSRGMACSVYGAQYLLESLFNAGRDAAALQLLTARTERSWWHMLEQGSTMTTEAWDVKFKKNLTWNHAWGAAPANLITRHILGVRPAEPGYKTILIAPQPGGLKWAKGKVPTAAGPVEVSFQNLDTFKLEIEVPVGTTARVELPGRKNGRVFLDGKGIDAMVTEQVLVIKGVSAGRHLLESR